MATNLFKRAAAYRKKHPHLSQTEAVQAVSKQDKKKPAHKKKAAKKKHTVGRARKKKAAPRKKAASSGSTKRRKTKAKFKKNGTVVFSIGSVSLSRIRTEHEHQARLHKCIAKHTADKKGKTPAERARVSREIKSCRAQLAASKKHVTQLKKAV